MGPTINRYDSPSDHESRTRWIPGIYAGATLVIKAMVAKVDGGREELARYKSRSRQLEEFGGSLCTFRGRRRDQLEVLEGAIIGSVLAERRGIISTDLATGVELMIAASEYTTKATRASEWKKFATFCDDNGVSVLGAGELDILEYIGWLLRDGTVAPSSLGNYLSAVNTQYRLLGLNPPVTGRRIANTKKGYAKKWVRKPSAVRIPTPAYVQQAILEIGISACRVRNSRTARACRAQIFQFYMMMRPQLAAAFQVEWIIEATPEILRYRIPAVTGGRKIKTRKSVVLERARTLRSGDISLKQALHPLDLFTAWNELRASTGCQSKFWFNLPADNGRPSEPQQLRWLQTALSQIGYKADPNTIVLPHRHRAGGSSCAHGTGVTVHIINHYADWSQTGTTFVTKYWDPSYQVSTCGNWFGDLCH